MLTQKQIKNLKPGDPIVINGTVNKINEDGHILATCGGSAVWIDNPYYVSFDSEQEVPTPKYDPTRLFKKGDKVRTVKRRGRYYSSADEKYADLILTVHSDEVATTRESDIWVKVETEDDEISWNTDPVYLELVTPVEELEPFTVVHKQALQHFQINHGKLNYMTFPYGLHKSNGWYHTITTAKAAAEAECDRLNAEYRKEQNND